MTGLFMCLAPWLVVLIPVIARRLTSWLVERF